MYLGYLTDNSIWKSSLKYTSDAQETTHCSFPGITHISDAPSVNEGEMHSYHSADQRV